MTEDKFLDRLRRDAQSLRYEPSDDFLWSRLTSRILEEIRAMLLDRHGIEHVTLQPEPA